MRTREGGCYAVGRHMVIGSAPHVKKNLTGDPPHPTQLIHLAPAQLRHSTRALARTLAAVSEAKVVRSKLAPDPIGHMGQVTHYTRAPA